jgi:Ubiquitin carboxyl-terminal hydrolase
MAVARRSLFAITTQHDLTNTSYPGPEALYNYELFAVINHEGQIGNGHYTSFARFQDTVGHLPSLLGSLTHSPASSVVPLRRRQGDGSDALQDAWCFRAGLHGLLRQAASGLQATHHANIHPRTRERGGAGARGAGGQSAGRKGAGTGTGACAGAGSG